MLPLIYQAGYYIGVCPHALPADFLHRSQDRRLVPIGDFADELPRPAGCPRPSHNGASADGAQASEDPYHNATTCLGRNARSRGRRSLNPPCLRAARLETWRENAHRPLRQEPGVAQHDRVAWIVSWLSPTSRSGSSAACHISKPPHLSPPTACQSCGERNSPAKETPRPGGDGHGARRQEPGAEREVRRCWVPLERHPGGYEGVAPKT